MKNITVYFVGFQIGLSLFSLIAMLCGVPSTPTVFIVIGLSIIAFFTFIVLKLKNK